MPSKKPFTDKLVDYTIHSLYREFVLGDRTTEDVLHGWPNTVEFVRVIDVHDSILGGAAVPWWGVQEWANSCQHNLKHGETATKTLACQQITCKDIRNLENPGISPQQLKRLHRNYFYYFKLILYITKLVFYMDTYCQWLPKRLGGRVIKLSYKDDGS